MKRLERKVRYKYIDVFARRVSARRIFRETCLSNSRPDIPGFSRVSAAQILAQRSRSHLLCVIFPSRGPGCSQTAFIFLRANVRPIFIFITEPLSSFAAAVKLLSRCYQLQKKREKRGKKRKKNRGRNEFNATAGARCLLPVLTYRPNLNLT